MAANIQNPSFIKELAANDRATRDKAVNSLRTYLAGRPDFEEIELLKLWKGLFYCMWMSDRPKTQQRLAMDLANLVDIVREETVIQYLNAFWETMAREWTGIDVLRMNKFLFLVRQYLAASLRYLAVRKWENESLLQGVLDVLRRIPLNVADSKIPNGLRYHMVDIYVDELDKVDSSRDGRMPLDALLEPLRTLGQQSLIKAIRLRVKDELLDYRLKSWDIQEAEFMAPPVQVGEALAPTAGADDEEWDGFGD